MVATAPCVLLDTDAHRLIGRLRRFRLRISASSIIVAKGHAARSCPILRPDASTLSTKEVAGSLRGHFGTSR